MGHKKDLARLSSQAAAGSDQLTAGEEAKTQSSFLTLVTKDQNPGVSKAHPKLSMLRWRSCFQLVMQK